MTEHIQRPRRNVVFTPALNPNALTSGARSEGAWRIIRTFDEAYGLLDATNCRLTEKTVLRDVHRIVAIADRMEDRQ